MKRIGLILIGIFIYAASWGQSQFPSPNVRPIWNEQEKISKLFWLATTDTTDYAASDYPGAISYRSGDSSLYVSDGHGWHPIASGLTAVTSVTNNKDSLFVNKSDGNTDTLVLNFYTKDSLYTKSQVDSVAAKRASDTVAAHPDLNIGKDNFTITGDVNRIISLNGSGSSASFIVSDTSGTCYTCGSIILENFNRGVGAYQYHSQVNLTNGQPLTLLSTDYSGNRSTYLTIEPLKSRTITTDNDGTQLITDMQPTGFTLWKGNEGVPSNYLFGLLNDGAMQVPFYASSDTSLLGVNASGTVIDATDKVNDLISDTTSAHAGDYIHNGTAEQSANFNISGNGTLDSLFSNYLSLKRMNFNGSTVTGVVSSNTNNNGQLATTKAVYRAMRIDTVKTIDDLINYPFDNNADLRIIIVTDSMRGGLFYKSTASISNDSGVVFPSVGGGHWVRQYDHTKGVNVDWWGSRDSYSILKAVQYAGEGGIINFSNNATYEQYDGIIPLPGQTFNGNNATLKRMPTGVDSLSSDGAFTDTFIVVHSVPADWKTGDWIQLYQDSIQNSNCIFTRRILSIKQDSVFLSYKLDKQASGDEWHPITKWAKDSTKVRKVFAQFSGVPYHSSAGDNYQRFDVNNANYPTNFTVNNLTFDGNKNKTSQNLSWYANQAIYARGDSIGIKIDHCTFIDLPNDCINGHGFIATNNKAYNLNSSFIHFSYFYIPGLPKNSPSFIENNYVNGINLATQDRIGHSQGAITLSFSNGDFIITGNRFENGKEGILGVMQNGVTSTNYGTNKFVLSNNYFRNFKSIAYQITVVEPTTQGRDYQFGNFEISNNILDSCGINDWTPYVDNFNEYAIPFLIGNNILTNGTVWKLPILHSDSTNRYVINNQTATSQRADINIAGGVVTDSLVIRSLSASTGDTLSLGMNDLGKVITFPMGGSSQKDTANLNAVLTKGNTSSVGMTVGSIRTTDLTIDDGGGSLSSADVLATDVSGRIIPADSLNSYVTHKALVDSLDDDTHVTNSIDLSTTGAKLLFTPNSSKGTYIVTNIWIVQTSSETSGSATVNLGTASPDYDNWGSNVSVGTPGQYDRTDFSSSLLLGGHAITSGQSLYLNVTSATPGIISIALEGFYVKP